MLQCSLTCAHWRTGSTSRRPSGQRWLPIDNRSVRTHFARSRREVSWKALACSATPQHSIGQAKALSSPARVTTIPPDQTVHPLLRDRSDAPYSPCLQPMRTYVTVILSDFGSAPERRLWLAQSNHHQGANRQVHGGNAPARHHPLRCVPSISANCSRLVLLQSQQ